MINLLNCLTIINTGDDSKPWLIAVCLIVSVVVLVAMVILGSKASKDKDDKRKDD